VSRRRQILGSLVVVAALSLLVPAVSMAGGSAGDQQYVDPLGGSGSSGSKSHSKSTTTHPPAPTTTSPSTAPSSPPTTSTSPAVISSNSTTSTTASTTSSSAHAADPSTSSTLPRTGLDVELAVAVGVGLLGAGLALRRTVHQQ
jgi:cytoskeletal protein RodZ